MKKLIIILSVILMFVSFASAAYQINNTGGDSFTANQSQTVNSNFLITNNGITPIKVTFTDIMLSSDKESRNFARPNNEITLIAGENKTISYSIALSTIPYMYAGNYTGYFNITDNESNLIRYNINLSLNEKKGFTLSKTSIDFGEAYYNKSIPDYSFVITNNGNINLTDVKINATGSSYNLSVSPSSVSSLKPGDSQTIDVNLIVKSIINDEKDDIDAGTITVSANGINSSISTIVDLRSYFSMSKVKIELNGKTQTINGDGDSVDEKAQPLDPISISVELENLFDTQANKEIDIDSAEVEIIIEGIDKDGEDIELTSDSTTLDYSENDRKHTFDFDFDVPMEADDGDYNIKITATGTPDEEGYGDEITIEWNIELKVKRDTHDLIIYSYDINPADLSCVRNTVIDFEIVNIGSDDEDYVRYTVKNSELGINYEKSRFEIISDSEDDENRYRESIPVALANAKSGTYPVELRIYRDYDLIEGVTAKNIIIKECSTGTTQKEEPPKEKVEEKPVIVTKLPEKKEENKQETTVGNIISRLLPKVNIADGPIIIGRKVINLADEFRQSNAYIVFIAAVNILAIIAIILMLVLYFKK